MTTPINDEFVSDVLKLGSLLMEFAKVNRATYLDKNKTVESDTDHTVMLSIMACAIASKLDLRLDIGKIAQYALVHDLVEVYAGDVNTLNFHAIDQKLKDKNEAKALRRIKKEFGGAFPWIHETIEAYDKLEDRESRFIKTLDKVLPAITHEYTDDIAVHEGFDNPEDFEESVVARNLHMRKTFAHDQELIMQLREKILKGTVKRVYEYHGKKRLK